MTCRNVVDFTSFFVLVRAAFVIYTGNGFVQLGCRNSEFRGHIVARSCFIEEMFFQGAINRSC